MPTRSALYIALLLTTTTFQFHLHTVLGGNSQKVLDGYLH